MIGRVEKAKAKINAKKFISDFRSGKSDQELMESHGLDKQSLDKVFRILVQKKLLSQSDLLEGHSFRSVPQEDIGPNEPYHRASEPRFTPPEALSQPAKNDSSKCPQCGASVSAKRLMCPECGHVLPGEERWADLGAKDGFFDRLPPKLLGLLIALPCALILLYLFRDVIVPMAEKTVEKRQADLAKDWTYGKGAIDIAKQMSRSRGEKVVQIGLERLFAEGILLSSDADYTTFTVGPRWHLLPVSEKERYLDEIRAAMIEAKLDVHFQVVDSGGQPVARVGRSSIDFGPFTGPSDSSWTDIGTVAPAPTLGDPRQDALQRSIGQKLPFARPPDAR